LLQVAEIGFPPTGCTVAVRTLTCIMSFGSIANVAALAVNEVGMDEVVLRPAGIVVAGGALTFIVRGRSL
jgi:hypothetical protein